ncbi:phosphatase 2C-like domain-containing protein [Dipodascopsis tothii]|uniref:phosphatase 2C-like domain-containing protein n=1 Tax=Dipodascopsis tothii TaxID=44089 RepID=UPI0034CDAE4B
MLDEGSAGAVARKAPVRVLDDAQVSARLREHEESYLVGAGPGEDGGVVRYDTSFLASNSPIEDDHAEKIVDARDVGPDGGRWFFWGVYDGHGGWTTSATLREYLISYVAREVAATVRALAPGTAARARDAAVDAAMERGFEALDDEIVHRSVERLVAGGSKPAAAEALAPALSGSCGLLAFYDAAAQTLRVACTGDSRAVLGHRGASGRWTATPLSVDQTGDNEEECRRLREEHPGEGATVVRHGRVLGSLQPTRAFGDARYKWPADVQRRIADMFFGRRTPANLLTPPYVTAKPVVMRTRVVPERGDFVVLATDGVFDVLSNQQVVSLVVEWLKAQPDFAPTRERPSALSRLLPWTAEDIVDDDNGAYNNVFVAKPSVRELGQFRDRYVIDDANAATHIVRNALGGADREHVAMLASIPAPFSRNYRDDMTVTVVFFGDQPGVPAGGDPITVNTAATRGGPPRPKL